MPARRRLDAEMVRRGLVPSRESARRAIEDGVVLVGGAPAAKPSRLVAPDDPVEIIGPPPRFVSRGGDKLDAALDRFAVEVEGRRCLDAGASTGGFTDCLLQRDAASVVAVDVGYGQLDLRLRADPRVEVHERTNIRTAPLDSLGGPFDVIVADLSFISLKLVLPVLVGLARPGTVIILLVKPQFEAGRALADRARGVIRDEAVWRDVVAGVDLALREQGASIMGWMVSPLRGADGNVEFLVAARLGSCGGRTGLDLDALMASVG